MKVNLFAKDPTVFPPLAVEVPEKTKVRPGPTDNRIQVIDRVDFPKAKPDHQGNFLYSPDQPEFDGCEAFATLRNGMALYSKILGRELPFAFAGKVRILPHDDVGINAFYIRDDHAVHFLEMTSPKFKKYPKIKNQTLRMAQSLDVAAHEEVGHLLLDGLKPDYLNFELETQAFHEAFGDISAMIEALQSEQVIDGLLKETGGNLRKSNVETRLGKEAGMAIQALSPRPDPTHFFLRDAIFTMQYDWKYAEPEQLGDWDPVDETKLGAEPHNFSRFFSGLWYEALVNLYEQDPARSKDPKTALRNARDIAASLIVRAAADFAPETTGRYSEIAKAMLAADRIDFQGAHQDLLKKIFEHRELLSRSEMQFDAVPLLKTTRPILTRKDAKAFLETHKGDLGIASNISLRPLANRFPGQPRFVYQNRKGETFVLYDLVQERELQGSQGHPLHGARYQVRGSLKLGFDKNGTLIHLAADLPTEQKGTRVEQSLHKCHENDYITLIPPGVKVNGPHHFYKHLSTHHKVPYIAYASWKSGKKVIERVPVFC